MFHSLFRNYRLSGYVAVLCAVCYGNQFVEFHRTAFVCRRFVESLDELARRMLEINELKRLVVLPPSNECENLRFYTTDFNRCVEVKCPDSPRAKTAWLNGACVALTCKDWQGKAPFELENRFPKTYSDFEKFCDWATQLAYANYAGEDFKIQNSWIIE